MIKSPLPRILLITRNMPPLVGGMERLNWHLVEEFSRGADVRVVAPKGTAACAPVGKAVLEVPLRPLFLFLVSAALRAWRLALVWRPNWIVAGSGLTAPLVWLVARTFGAKCAVYAHGLDLAIAHPLYRLIWYPALRKSDLLIANSSVTADLAASIGVRRGRIRIVHPGTSIPRDRPPDINLGKFRDELNLERGPVLLSVGRLSTRKGLKEFVIDILPAIVARYPSTVLLIVGGAPSDALHAKAQTPEEITEAANEAGVGSCLRFLGVITDREDLASIYRASDVHVFPVRDLPGDPEGFGMVAIEAAAHGVPTVGYATGGIRDAVADGISGRLVASGNAEAFKEALLGLLANPMATKPILDHAACFDWRLFGEKMRLALSLPSVP